MKLRGVNALFDKISVQLEIGLLNKRSKERRKDTIYYVHLFFEPSGERETKDHFKVRSSRIRCSNLFS